MNYPRPSANCFAIIKGFEKFRPTAYAATNEERRKGVWTCGYGHTHGVTEHTTCTMPEALVWLSGDVESPWQYLCRVCKVALNQNQVDALVSLGMNILDALSPNHTLMQKLNAGDYSGAADQILRWDYQAGAELAGLKARRQQERALFLKPVAG